MPSDQNNPVDVTKPLLALARELNRAFEDAAHSDGDKREQFAVALVIISKFLAEVISHQHANALFELGSAIADLNSGAVHSLLDPPKDIARRDTSQTWRSRANAVLAVEALHATGSPLDLAAGDVLRMIKQHLGGEPWVSVRTLLTWRKEFSAGRVKNDEANEVFAVGRELVQARCGDTQYLRQIAIGRAKAAGKVDGVFGPALKAFHQHYYHPSNARLFFYGDDDPDERLRLLDSWLSAFDPIAVALFCAAAVDADLCGHFEHSSTFVALNPIAGIDVGLQD